MGKGRQIRTTIIVLSVKYNLKNTKKKYNLLVLVQSIHWFTSLMFQNMVQRCIYKLGWDSSEVHNAAEEYFATLQNLYCSKIVHA